MVMLIALAVAAAAPSPEALTLGRHIAESGTLASILPLIQQKEAEELIAAHPNLSNVDKERLRATARRVYQSGRDRLMQAEARAFAERLGVDDLRAIVRFQSSAAGTRFRAATPTVIGSMMRSIGQMDYKGDVVKAFCRETGKLCAK